MLSLFDVMLDLASVLIVLLQFARVQYRLPARVEAQRLTDSQCGA